MYEGAALNRERQNMETFLRRTGVIDRPLSISDFVRRRLLNGGDPITVHYPPAPVDTRREKRGSVPRTIKENPAPHNKPKTAEGETLDAAGIPIAAVEERADKQEQETQAGAGSIDNYIVEPGLIEGITLPPPKPPEPVIIGAKGGEIKAASQRRMERRRLQKERERQEQEAAQTK